MVAERKTWLDRRHPSYYGMAAHWRFLGESYRGGPGWFHAGNLPKYPSEHPEKYAHRLANATRDNYTREVVDRHTSYLYQSTPTRTGSPAIQAFWAHAKREAGNVDDLAREMATLSALYGFCAVVIDKPAGTALTRADDRLPYAYTLTPPDILDWATDEDGRLLWVLTAERARSNADPKDPDNGGYREQYRLRTRDGWEVYQRRDGEPTLIEAGMWRQDGASLGAVPVVFARHQDSDDDYATTGLVDEIARIDRLIAQEQTSLHEVIEWLGAPTLVYPGEVENPITLGVSGVITYSEASGTPPQFLAVDGGYITGLQARIVSLIDKLRELASLPTRAGVNQSGESKRWDSAELQARLAAKAQNMQAAELQIASVVDRFFGGDGQPNVSVQYPGAFDVTRLADDVQAALLLNELPGQLSATYRVRLAQRLARKSLPDEASETVRRIEAEIAASITEGDSLPAVAPEVDTEAE